MLQLFKFVFFRFFVPVFALGENFTLLFIARALQGIGSACSSVSGELFFVWFPALFTNPWAFNVWPADLCVFWFSRSLSYYCRRCTNDASLILYY